MNNQTQEVEQKTCNVCKETKPVTEYYRGSKCKECAKVAQRNRNKKAKELQNKIKTDPELKNKPKPCNQCHKIKTVGDFRINRGECLECEKAFGRKYNQEHKDIRQKWQDDNREHFEELKAKCKTKYMTDPCYRMHNLIRRCLTDHIVKIKTVNEYTGCQMERVVDWLEYNFTDEMTWENHGTVWDVDHVIPIKKWDLKSSGQIDICFNWKNLSPLTSSKNRNGKRNNIVPDQIEKHLRNLQKYFIENNLDETELLTYLNDYGKNLSKHFNNPLH